MNKESEKHNDCEHCSQFEHYRELGTSCVACGIITDGGICFICLHPVCSNHSTSVDIKTDTKSMRITSCAGCCSDIV